MNMKSLRSQLDERQSTRVADTRKESLFSMVDKDGDGTISREEFSALYEEIATETRAGILKEDQDTKKLAASKRRNRLLAFVLVAMAAFLSVSVVANFAVMFYVVEESKETHASESGVLEVKGTTEIAKTAQAMVNLPLVVAPLLTMKQLSEVNFITARRDTFFLDHPGGLGTEEDYQAYLALNNGGGIQDRLYTSGFQVTGFDWTSKTKMTFRTSEGLIKIENGLVALHTEHTQEPLCSTHADCAAFEVNAIDADALLDEAAYLLADPFLNTTTTQARKLGIVKKDGKRQLAHGGRCTRALFETVHPSEQPMIVRRALAEESGRKLNHWWWHSMQQLACCLYHAVGGGEIDCCYALFD